jgi:hypothetical protein
MEKRTLTDEQKEGRRLIKARYRAAHREELRKKSLEYKQRNRDKVLAGKAAYYAANKEKAAAYKAEYRKAREEQIKAQSAAYREATKEHRREYNARYRTENSERVQAYNRSWAKNNPEKANNITATRRSQKMKATPTWADGFAIVEAYRLAELRKKVCGGRWHVDHIVPLKSKLVCGLHCEFNLQVIPGRENQVKSNRVWPGMPC